MKLGTVLSVLIVTFTCITVQAKEIKLKGFYITNSNDTLRCVFILHTGMPDLFPRDFSTISSQQYEIDYIGASGVQQKLFPNSVKGFEFDYEGRHYKYCSVKNEINIAGFNTFPYLFLELKDNGYLKYYIYKAEVVSINHNVGGTKTSLEMHDILKKGEEPMVDFCHNTYGAINYYKKLSNYFSDYPELSQKIKEKQYKYDDMIIIVKEYNHWKLNNNGK